MWYLMVARKILYRLSEVRIGKTCLSQSPFDITRQASCCQTVIIGTIFFLSYPHTYNKSMLMTPRYNKLMIVCQQVLFVYGSNIAWTSA